VAWARAAVPERVISCSSVSITKALRALSVRMDSSSTGGAVSCSTRPLLSVMRLISIGATM
jgi:hypothetical protein